MVIFHSYVSLPEGILIALLFSSAKLIQNLEEKGEIITEHPENVG